MVESHRDAIALLKEDHRRVESLFEEFTRLGSGASTRRGELCTTIGHELDAHTKFEQELFYPAMESHEHDLITEATREHDAVDRQLAELRGMNPADHRFSATMRELIEDVKHHIEEEERELFPAAERALGRDRLRSIGEQIQRRKELMGRRPPLASLRIA